ncbi:hypothetical protein APB26_32160 [Pseudomonas aeruginosa]|uniref:hypothetical protein n=1 Tax=Pseudomonas aeruginosa TaxID=287 RepID=UPI00071BF725|nr:hypothetical protein [Pseudomonas aeruginosa]KSQ21640.1 hypothetical protein APB26_32160 [Pseudomonas aeruginosa]RPV61310.1 hypothetical protein IPC838_18495 [Pseudomonas aeruginosa]
MFGRGIQESGPQGMTFFINDVPVATVPGTVWNKLRSEVRSSNRLKVRQVRTFIDGIFETLYTAAGFGLKALAFFLIVAILQSPAEMNAVIASGFATNIQTMLYTIIKSTVVVTILFAIYERDQSLWQDPVQEEMWRLVRVSLGIPVEGTYRAEPVTASAPAVVQAIATQ